MTHINMIIYLLIWRTFPIKCQICNSFYVIYSEWSFTQLFFLLISHVCCAVNNRIILPLGTSRNYSEEGTYCCWMCIVMYKTLTSATLSWRLGLLPSSTSCDGTVTWPFSDVGNPLHMLFSIIIISRNVTSQTEIEILFSVLSLT